VQRRSGGRTGRISVAFLFPGQGSQRPGMLRELPEHDAISETLAAASGVLDEDVLALDEADALASTVNAQLTLLVAGVASARVLVSEETRPDVVAGHSVGTFAAAVVAGVINFDDALRTVRLRGELMEKAYPDGYGMAAIVGLTERKVRDLVDEASSNDAPVFVANVNSPTQIAISGEDEAVARVLDSARAVGARRAERLPVRVPSHSPLMAPVAERLAEELAGVRVHSPDVPCAGNRSARLLRDAEAVRQDLASNVAHPVRWHDATTLLFEVGARLFVEMPPGHVLTRLAEDAFPEARSLALEEASAGAASRLAARSRGLV
jgi:malonate decarboxylase epsilon subunit